VKDSIGPLLAMPALFTTTSRWPAELKTLVMAVTTESWLVTSSSRTSTDRLSLRAHSTSFPAAATFFADASHGSEDVMAILG